MRAAGIRVRSLSLCAMSGSRRPHQLIALAGLGLLSACSLFQGKVSHTSGANPGGSSKPVTVAVCAGAPIIHLPNANPPRRFDRAPSFTLDATKGYCAYVSTTKGTVGIRLRPDAAPHTANNFIFLAQQGFYDGLTFYRACPGTSGAGNCTPNEQLIEAGDPQGEGTGGPGYTLPLEPVLGDYVFGSVMMAADGSADSGSRFIISRGDNRSLSKKYNLFGQVTDGLTVATQLTKGSRILWVDIETDNGVPRH